MIMPAAPATLDAFVTRRPAPSRAAHSAPFTPSAAVPPPPVPIAPQADALHERRRRLWGGAVTVASVVIIAVCVIAQIAGTHPADASAAAFALAGVSILGVFGVRWGMGIRAENDRLRRELDAARETERWHQAVLNDVAEAVMVASPEGRLLESNQAAWRLLGRTRDELSGRRMWDLLPLDERVVALRRGELVSTHGGGLRRLLRPDGTAILADVSWSTLDDGRMIYLARPFK
jgi:PAS domain S-box-containing protein